VLDALRDRPDRAGIFLDFDGSLSPIVAHPDLADPATGAREVLAELAARYRVVAVVSGRPIDDLTRLLAVDGLVYEGLYGMTEPASDLALALLPSVERAASAVEGAWVEDKHVSIAVHYRGAGDARAARASLVTALEPIAAESGLEVLEGKMVLELVPSNRPLKGGAIERLAGETRVAAALFAGDDVADLDAFAALDRLRAAGVATVKVAVRGDETPSELVEAADVLVDGPGGLVDLLRSLV
jgi:trehalose 6-phosphate phosphatase